MFGSCFRTLAVIPVSDFLSVKGSKPAAYGSGLMFSCCPATFSYYKSTFELSVIASVRRLKLLKVLVTGLLPKGRRRRKPEYRKKNPTGTTFRKIRCRSHADWKRTLSALRAGRNKETMHRLTGKLLLVYLPFCSFR